MQQERNRKETYILQYVYELLIAGEAGVAVAQYMPQN